MAFIDWASVFRHAGISVCQTHRRREYVHVVIVLTILCTSGERAIFFSAQKGNSTPIFYTPQLRMTLCRLSSVRCETSSCEVAKDRGYKRDRTPRG